MTYYHYYRIDENRVPVPCTIEELVSQNRRHGHKVAYTEFIDWKAAVSTVFLAVNHNWEPGPPLIFETMVFAGDHPEIDEMCERYSTWDDAIVGHNNMVDVVEAYLNGLAIAGKGAPS